MSDDEYQAFNAGFMCSAEGFNGKFTPSGVNLDNWLRTQYEEWANE
jgi:hypothetical protein